MEDYKTNKRSILIDLMKGIGILLVIYGHCMDYGSIEWNYVFAFHMPLFFLLSGYCFVDCQTQNFILKKIKSLILPYFKFYLLGLFLTLSISEWRKVLVLDNFIRDWYMMAPDAIHNSSIWFLVNIFLVSIFFKFIKMILLKNYKITFFLFVNFSVIFLGLLIAYVTKRINLPFHRLPWTLDVVFISLSFYMLGYFFKLNKNVFCSYVCNDTPTRSLRLLLYTVLLSLSVHVNQTVNLHAITLGNPFIYYVGAISGSLLIFEICRTLLSLDFKKIIIPLVFLGRNSLLILGIQSIVIRLIILLYNSIFKTNFSLYSVYRPYSYLIFFTATTICSLICVYIIKFKNKI